MSDTLKDVQARVTRMMAGKTAAERLRMASSMFDAGRALVIAGLKKENPSLSPQQLRAATFHRLYGNDLPPRVVEKITALLREG